MFTSTALEEAPFALVQDYSVGFNRATFDDGDNVDGIDEGLDDDIQ